IVIDDVMPGMRGHELLGIIRKELRRLTKPFFILSSSTERALEKTQLEDWGFDETLLKPIRVGALQMRLTSLMEGDLTTSRGKSEDSRAHGPIPKGRHEGLTGGLGDPNSPDKELAVLDIKNRRNILLVEDNEVNQILAQTILSRAGYRVELASNGEEGIQALNRTNFDCVLMDIQMPVLDGLAATKRIRRTDSAFKNVPIIAMTANAMQGDRERCIQAGMNDYVPKPIETKLLLNRVDFWAGKDQCKGKSGQRQIGAKADRGKSRPADDTDHEPQAAALSLSNNTVDGG
ncbi:MAG: response regulator, partial [Kiloniellales bacterium]|nr:response regulator [Kiloniellales bacterium]